MSYDLRFITKTVRALKRDFGVPVNIVWRVSSTPNLATGAKAVIKDSLSVDRALVLPAALKRDFVYDLTVIASNKNFTYGGLFDLRSRRVILDSSDLPADFEIKVGYYLIIWGQRFDVREVERFGGTNAYVLLVEQVTSVELANVLQLQTFSLMFLENTVSAEVE